MHLDRTVCNAFKNIGLLKRVCQKFNNVHALRAIYIALERSKLQNSVVNWSPYYNTDSIRLECAQNKFLKFINFKLGISQSDYNTSYLLSLLNLKPLSDRRSFIDALFLYKVICSYIDCSLLLSVVNFNAPRRSSRNPHPFVVNYHRTNDAFNSPLSRMMRNFNKFDQSFDFSISLSRFQSHLWQIWYYCIYYILCPFMCNSLCIFKIYF